jgi:hypothetical protein
VSQPTNEHDVKVQELKLKRQRNENLTWLVNLTIIALFAIVLFAMKWGVL